MKANENSMSGTHDRPEPEDFGGAAMRLLENGVISEMTAYNLTRATDVTMDEAVRVLTDIAIGVRKQLDNLSKELENQDEGDQCPCCSKQLTEGCCIECGEVYEPNP